MTTAAKKKDVQIKGEVHPLLAAPIPHAYAFVPHPTNPVKFYAVHLQNVTAEMVECLEPSDRAEPIPFGLMRINAAMERRHKERKWT